MDVPETPERWSVVGMQIADRIDELNLLNAEVQRMANISDKTLTGYIAGKPIVRADKRRGICTALGWSSDSIARLLRGEDPVVVATPGGSEPVSDSTDLHSRIARLSPSAQQTIKDIIDAEERRMRSR